MGFRLNGQLSIRGVNYLGNTPLRCDPYCSSRGCQTDRGCQTGRLLSMHDSHFYIGYTTQVQVIGEWGASCSHELVPSISG